MGPPPLDPLLGKVLQGKYRIESHIASGAMGAVYRGKQLAVERNVAVKILKLPDTLKGDDRTRMVRRFEREARLTSQLQHPHSIRVFDYGETEDGRPYLVMELLRGPTLKAVLRSETKLPAWRVARIVRQMCKALQEAHAMGVVHRDLKPDNVFLVDFEGERDFVKVVDYGIARVAGGDTDQESMTHTGTTLGTPKYMSPEQALGRPVSARTDLYALGVMVHEMLTGQAPYHADNPIATAMQHVSAPVPPLPPIGLPVEVEDAWRALVQRMMAKKPDDRPSSAATVAAALEHLEIRSREALGVGSHTEEEIVALLRAPELAEDAEGGPTTVAIGPGELGGHDDATVATDALAGMDLLEAPKAAPKTPPAPPKGAAPPAAPTPTLVTHAPAPKRRTNPIAVALGAAALLAAGFGVAALLDRSSSTGHPAPVAQASDMETRGGATTPAQPTPAPAAPDAGTQAQQDASAIAAPTLDAGPVDAGQADAQTAAAGGDTLPAAPDAATVATADAAGSSSGTTTPEPPKARLLLTSDPTGARVTNGKDELCTTPCDEQLPPGELALRVSRSGYRDRTVSLTLKAGDTTEDSVRLSRVTTVKKEPETSLPPIRLGPK